MSSASASAEQAAAPRLDEPASLERPNVCLGQLEPLPDLASIGEAGMPVALNASWIVGPDDVNLLCTLGELERDLVPPPPV